MRSLIWSVRAGRLLHKRQTRRGRELSDAFLEQSKCLRSKNSTRTQTSISAGRKAQKSNTSERSFYKWRSLGSRSPKNGMASTSTLVVIAPDRPNRILLWILLVTDHRITRLAQRAADSVRVISALEVQDTIPHLYRKVVEPDPDPHPDQPRHKNNRSAADSPPRSTRRVGRDVAQGGAFLASRNALGFALRATGCR